jgi:hypothetical protein
LAPLSISKFAAEIEKKNDWSCDLNVGPIQVDVRRSAHSSRYVRKNQSSLFSIGAYHVHLRRREVLGSEGKLHVRGGVIAVTVFFYSAFLPLTYATAQMPLSVGTQASGFCPIIASSSSEPCFPFARSVHPAKDYIHAPPLNNILTISSPPLLICDNACLTRKYFFDVPTGIQPDASPTSLLDLSAETGPTKDLY